MHITDGGTPGPEQMALWVEISLYVASLAVAGRILWVRLVA